ncbi:MAG: TonB-dependent receptor [Gemmatimonadales bacterium]
MRRPFSAVLGFLLLTSAASLSAQAPSGPPAGAGPQAPAANGEVRGTVIDSASKAPVGRASVAVRSKADNALVTGAIAGTDGSFRIQGLRPGVYTLRVTYIGYGPRVEEFAITPAAQQAAVGNVGLSRVAVALQGVEVTAERDAVTIEPDRNSYRSKDVAPAANNASEVLDNVPSVQIDGEGKISLRGNENVAVQINGRPAPIRGPQLAAYLKQIPANILDRIEVIPNPSAKYDPEGMAGIINIVLKANVDLGMSGGVTVAGATADRFNTSGNIGYQSGPYTLFTSYGYNSDNRGLTGINDRERYTALSAPLSFTDQDILGESMNNGHNFTTTLDYKVNARDVLSNSLLVNRRNNAEDSRSLYTERDASRSVIDTYDRLRNSDGNALMFDYTLAFKRTLEPRKHEISTELRYNRSKDDDRTQLWKQALAAGNPVDREIDDTDALTQSLNAQLDYTKTLAARTKIETGYKGTARFIDREYLVTKDSLGNNQWLRSNLSNDFQFDDQVHATYGVLSHGIGKWDLQGGLRAEYATRDFSLARPATSYPYNYTSLFPSGVASYKFSDKTQAKLSYSRRIRRPGTQELNPFPVFFDAQNVFIGNPKLNPEYTHAIEGGLTRTGMLGTLQLSPFFRRTTDVIRVDINTDDVVDGRSVTSVSFRNLATSDSYGADLNGNMRLGKKFSGFAAFNVFRIVTDGGSESALSSDAVAWATRFNATFNPTDKLTLQGNWFYRAPINVEKGRFSAQTQSSFAVRQKVYGDKATIALRVVDPFNTAGFKIRAGNDDVIQITERKFGVRGTFLSFQYNFGQAPKIRLPQPQDQQSGPGFPSGG